MGVPGELQGVSRVLQGASGGFKGVARMFHEDSRDSRSVPWSF